ncbi:unnamed protein product [Toxocara canis]|uniref:SHSP domain-containing protein n=1 Tax=Toxocara canis TaxID=6265 RepID=A0A183VDP8_TOXCA|nr:unnamed protein product [Toxocara canis]
MPLTNNASDDLNTIYTTSRGFLIAVDANGFRPEDFKVIITRNSVLVSAQRPTYDNGIQSRGTGDVLRCRHTIPSDVLLGSIYTTFTDSGILIIKGNREAGSKTDIPVEIGSHHVAGIETAQSRKHNPRQQTIFPANPFKYAVCRSIDV